MGSSNFQQWNPSATNQETDSQYTADALRSGGAANPSIFPSATANKAFYQWSTFIAALAQSLATKGYTVSDASLSTLAATLAAVMTQADMAPYAPLASPALTGTPTAPTAAAGDNSGKLANTNFLVRAITAGSIYNALFNALTLDSTLTVVGLSNLGGGAITIGPPANDSSNKVPNTNWVQTLLNSAFATSFANPGYIKLWNGLIIQWVTNLGGDTGFDGFGNKVLDWTFPIAFPNACITCVFHNYNGGALLGMDASIQSEIPNTVGVFAEIHVNGTISGPLAGNGIAIGY